MTLLLEPTIVRAAGKPPPGEMFEDVPDAEEEDDEEEPEST